LLKKVLISVCAFAFHCKSKNFLARPDIWYVILDRAFSYTLLVLPAKGKKFIIIKPSRGTPKVLFFWCSYVNGCSSSIIHEYPCPLISSLQKKAESFIASCTYIIFQRLKVYSQAVSIFYPIPRILNRYIAPVHFSYTSFWLMDVAHRPT